MRMAKKAKFSLKVQIGDKTYTSTGESAFEALKGLPRPPKIMSKVLVTITSGKLKKERLYYPVQAKRLFFTSPNMQQIQAKLLEAGMK